MDVATSTADVLVGCTLDSVDWIVVGNDVDASRATNLCTFSILSHILILEDHLFFVIDMMRTKFARSRDR